jgi:hypothetical protein
MKSKKTDLDIDFIGGQEALTPEEEKALSAYFKQRKLNKQKTIRRRKHSSPKQDKPTV